MSQVSDVSIANQGFSAFRTELNNILGAINSSHIGSSAPASLAQGSLWIDTSAGATGWILKLYDGAGDISLGTINSTANTVDWTDSSVTFDIVNDTSPQLGGDLDTNSANIKFDDAHGINDDSGNEFIVFQKTSTAVNQFDITNNASGSSPILEATGGDSNINVDIKPKGTGEVVVGTGGAGATVTSKGAYDLTLDTNSGSSSGTITITDGANGHIAITPNGTGNVQLAGDEVTIGDSGATSTLTSNGTGNLLLNTNSGTNSSSIEITDAANGDIDLTCNGTGKIKFNDLAYIPQQAITSSSNAVAWDVQAAPNAYHITTENTTFSAPSNGVEGAFICLEINFNGSHTIGWNTVFDFSASTEPTETATDAKTDIHIFRYNGAIWQEVGRTLNLSES